jgi:hypothetical protein
MEMEHPLVGELERAIGLDPDDAGDVPSLTLWHYTDAAGVRGILHEKVIRATHFAFTNDSSELRIGVGIVCEEAERLANEHDDKLKFLFQDFVDRQRKGWSIVDMPRGVFVASFCADKGNSLSQWRAYGCNGTGYAIGFANLAPHFNPAPDNDSDLGIVMVEVIYDDELERFRSVVRDKLAQAALAIFNFVGRNPEQGAELLRGGQAAMAIVAARQALRLKHHAFRDENEWRIVAIPHPKRTHRRDGEELVQQRVSARGLVPYVSVPLTGPKPLDLECVRLGPVHDPGRGIVALRAMLHTLGYENAQELAVASTIPFRPST